MLDKETPTQGFFVDWHIISVFAFIGGFVDASGYILLNGIYTASSTGNIIVAGASAYRDPHKALVRLIVLAAFGFGALLNATLGVKLRFATKLHRSQILSQMIALEVIVLAAAMVVCIVMHSLDDSDNSWFRAFPGSILSFTMGMQSATLFSMMPDADITSTLTCNFMTTVVKSTEAWCFFLACKGYFNLTKACTEESADNDAIMHNRYKERLVSCKSPCCVVVSFVTGALVGAPLAYAIHYWCFAVPIVILAVVAVTIHISGRMERRSCDIIDPVALQEVHQFCMTTDYAHPNTAGRKSHRVVDDPSKVDNIFILNDDQLGSRTYSSSSSI